MEDEDGVQFDVQAWRVDQIRKGFKYGGVRLRTSATHAGARVPVLVDTGFGDSVISWTRSRTMHCGPPIADIYSDASDYFGECMPLAIELLTLPEAAVVASVTVRDVNRVIDERILPEHFYTLDGGRRLHAAACPLMGFYFHSAKALTSEARGRVIERISERIGRELARQPIAHWRKRFVPADWTVSDGFLTVSLWEFASGAEDRHAMLTEALGKVVEDPDILGGTPIIRGTRIPVHDVAASVAAGFSHSQIRSAYGGLDGRAIELASIYAEAAPMRGRPKRPAMLPPDSSLVSERKVARRRVA